MTKNESNATQLPEPVELPELDFEDDTPLVCNRDQTDDTTCESCQ